MPRLPLLDRDGLVDELHAIGAALTRLDGTRPITVDAAARMDERRAILRTWQHDLEAQLAEVDEPPFAPVPYGEFPPGY